MVNYSIVQSAINRGMARTGTKLGQSMTLYRPLDADCPALSDLHQQGDLSVFLNTSANLNSITPSQYGKPQFYGAFDRTNTQVGDYLVGPQGTFFIASQQDLNTTMLILCNAVLTISRSTDRNASRDHDPLRNRSGAPRLDQIIVDQYPVSLLDKSRGEKGPIDLPLDSQKQGSWEVLTPVLPNDTTVLINDRAVDQLGNKYLVSAPELSTLGWRILITSESA